MSIQDSSDESNINSEDPPNEDYLKKNINVQRYGEENIFGDSLSKPASDSGGISLSSHSNRSVDEKIPSNKPEEKEVNEKEKVEPKKEEQKPKGVLLSEAVGQLSPNNNIDEQYRLMMAKRFEQQRKKEQQVKEQIQINEVEKQCKPAQPVCIGSELPQSQQLPNRSSLIPVQSNIQFPSPNEYQIKGLLMDDRPIYQQEEEKVLPEKKLKEEEVERQQSPQRNPFVSGDLREVLRDIIRSQLQAERFDQQQREERLLMRIESKVRDVVREEMVNYQQAHAQQMRDQQNLMHRLIEMVADLGSKHEERPFLNQ